MLILRLSHCGSRLTPGGVTYFRKRTVVSQHEEIEEGSRSPLHCGKYARCMPTQAEGDQRKSPVNKPCREEDHGGVEGNCRMR